MKTKKLVTLGATLVALTIGAAHAGTHVKRLDGERALVTDFSGKPPFKRTVVPAKDLSPAEFARFEEQKGEVAVDRSKIGKRVQVRDYTGKPPFNRRWVTVTEENAAEFARFEEQAEPTVRKRRGPSASGFPNR